MRIVNVYSLREFGDMIADAGRFDAYAKAIAATVGQGDVVAEIGCGPGVFSLLACQAGARRVFAIEMGDSIHLARELAAANGFRDRMEFFQGDSRRTELPERANVIVADIRGALPVAGEALAAMKDARDRLLAPGGVIIPQCDLLKAAVVEAREQYSRLASPWRTLVPGLDLSVASSSVLNQLHGSLFKTDQLLTEPETWAILNYAEGAPIRVSAALTFQVTRTGTAHGLCLWFEATLVGEITYSSGPDGRSTIYGQSFLPWPEPVAVTEGEQIRVTLRADPVAKEYVWQWEAKIHRNGAGAIQFRQSSMDGALFSAELLRRHSADCVPRLKDEGEADRWLLNSMDGKASLRDIAQSAHARFPQVFGSWYEAFERAAELAGKYSR